MKLVKFEIKGKVYGVPVIQAGCIQDLLDEGGQETRAHALIKRKAATITDATGEVEKEAEPEQSFGVTQGATSTLEL